MENVIPREQAESELQAFCDEHELDLSTTDSEERENLDRLKERIIGALTRGVLTSDDHSRLVLHVDGDTSLVFHEPTGADLVNMDRAKGDVAKMNRLTAAVCKVDPSVIAKMPNRRLKIAQAIITLFMG